jgi:hypothetical protein
VVLGIIAVAKRLKCFVVAKCFKLSVSLVLDDKKDIHECIARSMLVINL